ncbi:MAG: glycosyltransferase family 2 protein [Bacteroidaceae bacterium]|nr:glycosyltransferase family 2 protein [Bacteroidaceae bacterium]
MSKSKITIGVVISTYNNPAWLEKTLWGYLYQTRPADEIVIADDGSGEETNQLIRSFQKLLPIKHVWHEDNGFQKSRILNKALLAAESEYLIFTDQDCIPRKDFIAIHETYAETGYFLSGGYFKLPMNISKALTQEDVATERAFSIEWLREQGLKINFKCTKLVKSRMFTLLMNRITPRGATWNGCNASGWRTDMMRINGYNEEMHYGGQDREFGERLFNLGIKSKQICYSAIVLHLDHKRPYKTKESVDKNKAIRRNTRKLGIIETPNGIKQRHIL